MTRPRNSIAKKVTFDINEMAAHVFGMSNEELGEWMHKAIKDCIEGCKDPDTDCFVKKMYEESFGKMQQKQNINANFYRNRLARQAKELGSGKPDTDKTNDPALTAPSAIGYRAELALDMPLPDKDKRATHGECNTASSQPDERPESGKPFATTPYPSSISTNTAEDADTRKDSEKIDRTVAGRPVSTDGALLKTTTSSAEPLVTTPCRQISADEARQSQDRQVRCTVEFSLSGLNSKADRHCAATSTVQSAEAKKPYGTCGHVMLTDAEGRHLREVYGNNLAIAIDILDAYIENNGKAAKKYKNHAAVMRKGNWVWNKVQEMVLQQARIDKAKSQPKSFKQQDLDARTQFFKNSIAERMLQNEQ